MILSLEVLSQNILSGPLLEVEELADWTEPCPKVTAWTRLEPTPSAVKECDDD